MILEILRFSHKCFLLYAPGFYHLAASLLSFRAAKPFL
jgi:hypothetical protein